MAYANKAAIGELASSQAFQRARRRVFTQLIEALVFERLPAFTCTEQRDGQLEILIFGRDDQERPVHYSCQGRKMLSFGKIKLTNSIINRLQDGRQEEAQDIALFLEEMARSLAEAPSQISAFAAELEQTLLKEAAALQWVNEEESNKRGGNRSYDELEGDVLEGHPYHPCFKSRIGFSMADNEAYSPEFHPQFRLLWLAVWQEDVEMTSSEGIDGRGLILADVGAELLTQWERRLEQKGSEPKDYVYMPVHPWQWREVLSGLFFKEIASGKIVVLGESRHLYSPQQSIRTLANRTELKGLSIKLPLSIRNTSSLRTISPRHARNGPRSSARLAAMVAGDRYLSETLRLILLQERLGVSYRYERLPQSVRGRAEGTLCALWRDSVHLYADQGEQAVPFTALCHVRQGGQPFIAPWVQASGVEVWLHQLLSVVLHPLLHLLFAHGAAVEAHAQNLVLLHRSGVPSRLAVKDFSGGVLFYNGENANPAALPETDVKHDVRDVVHNALFFVNLAELALFLNTHYSFAEQHFWQAVADAIGQYERDFPQLAEQFQAYNLFGNQVFVGLLAARRLRGDGGERDHWIANALAGYRDSNRKADREARRDQSDCIEEENKK
ncbi:IucA/IucC family protein [Paenibacillus sp. FSL H8-0537]|uniref:IucA/IucC family protein n=1 Tax=Paenibacillus sp. FSL H8-0537 TaxID=2921399 RepID=UPI003101A8FD